MTGVRPQGYPQAASVWRVAVATPVHKLFDYLPPSGAPATAPVGCRVRVPFGRGTRLGIVAGGASASELPLQRLKQVHEVLDDAPTLPADLIDLLTWSAAYYHHPPGEVLCGALPGTLRRTTRNARTASPQRWRLTHEGRVPDLDALKNAPRQRALAHALKEAGRGMTSDELGDALGERWRSALNALRARGWVEADTDDPTPAAAARALRPGPALNPCQQEALATILAAQGFQAFLLDGVTGSGKTEVYFGLIEAMIGAGRQVLLLVPEIGLTPQMVERVRARFPCALAVLHSGLAGGERMEAWRMAAEGRAPIIVGTRSAVFVPAPGLGAIIVDEEHDASYKQQESLRYHARDLAVMRAHRLDIPVVLGSATPALESLHNAEQGRYRRLVLARRAGDATPPSIRLVDLRADRPENGLSAALAYAIEAHLARAQQVLLFLNRRGYAPTLLCQACGWVASCRRCDAHMVLHRSRGLVRCHHCDAQWPLPPTCPQCADAGLRALGVGTERMEETLAERFPQAAVLRMDRDSTRRKGAMASLMEDMRRGRSQILLGTQMLAKGHHLPNVTLAAVLDADQGLFGADFRAGERMGQLITQVAGRAGRADKPGEVIVQTRFPEHPLLVSLIAGDYGAFARALLEERRLAGMPPFRSMALVRAEAVRQDAPGELLTRVRTHALGLAIEGVELLGPAPAPMERRAGRYRSQLLLLADHRARLQALLSGLVPGIERLAAEARVRWSLDVDPTDEY